MTRVIIHNHFPTRDVAQKFQVGNWVNAGVGTSAKVARVASVREYETTPGVNGYEYHLVDRRGANLGMFDQSELTRA